MKQLIQSALLALLLCAGCSKSAIISKSKFTAEFAEALHKSSPELKVQVVEEMQLKVTSADNHDFTLYLDNAYDQYKQDPKSKYAIFANYVGSFSETVASAPKSEGLDRTLIIPVIKDRAWLDETQKALRDRGAKEIPEVIHEDLNSDLIIIYAEDSPQNIRYFTAKDLEKAHIQQEDLRSLACENLKRVIPKIERHGGDGLFMLAAGGSYEASLLLIDSVWDGLKKDVKGDIVIAIPTRDVLIVTGSDDSQGINKMNQIVKEASAQGSYRLTSKLFVHRHGRWVEFGR